MIVGSLFSGIGGLDLGLQKAGHTHAFFCESDPFRRRVLARHWPGVDTFADVRGFRRERGWDWPRDSLDLVAGGFPCQDLSVAGRRAGLDGSRSGLFFEFARVADALLPPGGWVLVENVPGLLSSNGGRDFAVLLSTLGELGFHDLAWRVLDSRYLGVPQRRRRVFILARRSRGRRASEVLLEPESGGGDFEAGREAREGPAGSVEAGPLTTRYGKGVNTTADDGAAIVSNGVRATPRAAGRVDDPAVTDIEGKNHAATLRGFGHGWQGQHWSTNAVTGSGDRNAAMGNPRPDGPRYAACGDAVTVNVSHWIGKRLMEFA